MMMVASAPASGTMARRSAVTWRAQGFHGLFSTLSHMTVDCGCRQDYFFHVPATVGTPWRGFVHGVSGFCLRPANLAAVIIRWHDITPMYSSCSRLGHPKHVRRTRAALVRRPDDRPARQLFRRPLTHPARRLLGCDAELCRRNVGTRSFFGIPGRGAQPTGFHLPYPAAD